MGVFQRTATTLVNKAGKTLVDLVLNANSNNPIANSAATAKFNQIDADLTELDTNLTANNKEFIFAYSNGSYGYKAGGADTFHPFKSGATYKNYAKGLGSCSIARSSGCVYPFYFEVAGNQQCSAGYVDSNGNITWLTTYAYTSNYHHVTVNDSTINLSNTQGGYMCYIWKIG